MATQSLFNHTYVLLFTANDLILISDETIMTFYQWKPPAAKQNGGQFQSFSLKHTAVFFSYRTVHSPFADHMCLSICHCIQSVIAVRSFLTMYASICSW